MPPSRTEDGGRCSSTTVENRTGGRKKRRNEDSRLRPHTVLPSDTKTLSDRWNKYKGRHRSQNTIRSRTRGGDTSLQKEKGVVSRMKQRHNPDARAYHEYYLNQAGRGYPVYIGTRFQRTWTRKYFRKSVQINRSFIKERSQNFGKRSFENRSEPSIGRHGRTERHTSSQIQIEINGTKLTPESFGHRGTSRWTIYKTSCKTEKAQTSPDEATEHIERHLRLKMALLHQSSCEGTKSELDLFGVPPTQTSVKHGYWEQKGLTSTLTDKPYEFAVSGAEDDYIDLFNTYLLVEAQIVNTDGSNLDPDADVGPVDLWMHSLFSDVSISLSEKLVSPPTSMYPYRAYIEPILSYGPAAKESELMGVMLYNDTPGQQDKRTADKKGFTARKKLTALSKSVGKLHLDLFCQDKYLFNHVDLKIKLRISPDARKWLCMWERYNWVPPLEWVTWKHWKRPAVNTPSDE